MSARRKQHEEQQTRLVHTAAAEQNSNLETVQHQLRVRADFLVDQEFADVGSLVAGQLDNFAQLFILHQRAVAAEVLLESLQDTLDVEVVGETLHGGQTLAAVTLLHTDVHLATTNAGVVLGVGESVCAQYGTAAAREHHKRSEKATLPIHTRIRSSPLHAYAPKVVKFWISAILNVLLRGLLFLELWKFNWCLGRGNDLHPSLSNQSSLAKASANPLSCCNREVCLSHRMLEDAIG